MLLAKTFTLKKCMAFFYSLYIYFLGPGKKCKIGVAIKTFKRNISLQLPLRSCHCVMFTKSNYPQKQPLRFFFHYRCSELMVKIFEKHL